MTTQCEHHTPPPCRMCELAKSSAADTRITHTQALTSNA